MNTTPRKAAPMNSNYSMNSATRPEHFADNYRSMRDRFAVVSVDDFLDKVLRCSKWDNGHRLGKGYRNTRRWKKITSSMGGNQVIEPFVRVLSLCLSGSTHT